uniref:Uncharacterized protein n=1 Tax=Anguilla anguilla TaxID=7936 RepID=A0A0E9RDL3_ANGAN
MHALCNTPLTGHHQKCRNSALGECQNITVSCSLCPSVGKQHCSTRKGGIKEVLRKL